MVQRSSFLVSPSYTLISTSLLLPLTQNYLFSPSLPQYSELPSAYRYHSLSARIHFPIVFRPINSARHRSVWVIVCFGTFDLQDCKHLNCSYSSLVLYSAWYNLTLYNMFMVYIAFNQRQLEKALPTSTALSAGEVVMVKQWMDDKMDDKIKLESGHPLFLYTRTLVFWQ